VAPVSTLVHDVLSPPAEADMRKLCVLIALLAGCGRASLENTDAGGGDGGGGDCSAHQDTASCEADPRCIALGCPSCNGTQSLAGCFDKNGPLPGIGCPLIACGCQGLNEQACTAAASTGCRLGTCCGHFVSCLGPGDPTPVCTADCVSCVGLTEALCKARTDCRADYCPACTQGSTFYAGCSAAASPPPMCVPPPCPPPPPSCDQLTNASDCGARADCHAVYEASATCACANCCCTIWAFNHCAAGGSADCKGPALCNVAPPDCGTPGCNSPYSVGYVNGCYEGCVLTTACAP
jgi:hypothetical protein